MKSYKLKNKNLAIPIRAASGGIIGDALIVIDLNHPDYEKWINYAADAPPEIEDEFGNSEPVVS